MASSDRGNHAQDEKLMKRFDVAIATGYEEDVARLLDEGTDVNTKGDLDRTPLHRAAFVGNMRIVRYLVERGADVNAFDRAYARHGGMPLHMAARAGHVEIVRYLLELGANVNAMNQRRSTALHKAARAGHAEVVRCLVERGANVNAHNWLQGGGLGATPLMKAAKSGCVEAVQYLLTMGADIHATNDNGQSALAAAAWVDNVEVTCCLLEHGADVNASANSIRWTPLRAAASRGHVDMIRALLVAGADMEERSKEGDSALLVAAGRDCIGAVRCLVEAGADVNAKTENGLTIIHYGASSGMWELIRCSLENGGDVNAKDKRGSTAIHYAAHRGSVDMMEYLFDNGADLNAANVSRSTPLHHAAVRGYLDAVCFLIENEVAVNALNQDGLSPLAMCVFDGKESILDQGIEERYQVVRQLCRSGAVWDGNCAKLWANRAIHEIRFIDHEDKLLQAGLGACAIHWIAQRERDPTARLLDIPIDVYTKGETEVDAFIGSSRS